MPTIIANRYRLDEPIGAGGMGQVWRARDLRLDRDVAAKVVDLATLGDPSIGARFWQEIVATARPNHPNIVTVYDGGVDGSTAYLVMELLRGRDLARVLAQQGPLPLRDGLLIAAQIVQGLAAAHAAGLIHRDIKPGNVMILDGQVKLLDFGIAQLADRAGVTLTATATTIGTAAYMAPEQAAGQPTSPATDRYALGCLLMTMFTGAPPFEGEPIAVAGRQLNSVPPRLSQRRPGLPPALDDLVNRLLSKQPADRPGTAEVLHVLTRITPPAQPGDSAPTTPVPIVYAPPNSALAYDPPPASVAPPGSPGLAGYVPPDVAPVSALARPPAVPGARSVAGGSDGIAPTVVLGGPVPSGPVFAGTGYVAAPPPGAPTAVLGATRHLPPAQPVTTAGPPSSGGSAGSSGAAARSNLPWIAGLIVTLILAVSAGGIGFVLARQLGATVSRWLPTASPATATRNPTTRPPSTAKPKPSATPTTQSPGSAALNGALAAVRAALNTLPPGPLKDQLLTNWDKASVQIAAGHNAIKKLADFEGAVDSAHQLGALGDLQYQTIKAALAAVRAFL